jgi:hypothetical protein
VTPVYFIFAKPRSTKDWGGVRNMLRIARRHPMLFYAWWLGRWTQLLTGQEAAHVAVGHSQAVFDSTVAGAAYWPWLGYWMKYPGTFAYVRVWTDSPPDLDQFRHMVGKRQQAWKTIVKFYTFDVIRPSNDCADVARTCLSQMGIPTPRSCRSPGGLLRYLEVQGYETVRFADTLANDGRSVDSGTRHAEPASHADGSSESRRPD